MSAPGAAERSSGAAADSERRAAALIADDAGLAVLRDAFLAAPAPGGREAALTELRRLARDGRLFFVDGEEALRFTAEILVDEPLPEAVAGLYEQVGGTYLLEAASGELHLSGFTAWERGEAGLALRVAPGPYALFVHSREHFNPAAFKAWERSTLGEADVAHRDRIMWLGAAGCLPTVVALLAVALPPLRRFALVPVAAAAVTWLTYGLLMRLPRSRAIARRTSELQAGLPLFYLQLQPLASGQGLSGGFVRLD